MIVPSPQKIFWNNLSYIFGNFSIIIIIHTINHQKNVIILFVNGKVLLRKCGALILSTHARDHL